jgi:hypothetical protein
MSRKTRFEDEDEHEHDFWRCAVRRGRHRKSFLSPMRWDELRLVVALVETSFASSVIGYLASCDQYCGPLPVTHFFILPSAFLLSLGSVP